jgi:hypothetical protein
MFEVEKEGKVYLQVHLPCQGTLILLVPDLEDKN